MLNYLLSSSFIFDTGVSVLLRRFHQHIEPVESGDDGDEHLVVQRFLRWQVLPAPVAEVFAAFQVASASDKMSDSKVTQYSPEESKV